MRQDRARRRLTTFSITDEFRICRSCSLHGSEWSLFDRGLERRPVKNDPGLVKAALFRSSDVSMDLDGSSLYDSGLRVSCSKLYGERVLSGAWVSVVLYCDLEVGGGAVGGAGSLDGYVVAIEEG